MKNDKEKKASTEPVAWDHSTHAAFFDHYAEGSQGEATAQRFRDIQATILRIAAREGLSAPLKVADIGCGAGTQCRMWAERGHHVYGVDVNEPLVRLAMERAAQLRLEIAFEVGSATALPWADASMDVCLLPELLEHVADWQTCLNEASRILRPGGLLFLSTNNVLCPKQNEFNLPLYSWYPAPLKRYSERLATTTHPQLVNFAKYPAINWFSFYGLRDFLRTLGFSCLDRFDLMDSASKGSLARLVIGLLRSVPPLRFLGHMATPSTYLVAMKARA